MDEARRLRNKITVQSLLRLIEFVGHEGDDDGDDEDDRESSARALLLNRAFDIVCCFFDTGDGISATSVKLAFQEASEDLTCLVRVSDVLERVGGILSGHVQNDLLSTWMLVQKVGGIVDFVVDDQVQILLIGMPGDLVVCE